MKLHTGYVELTDNTNTDTLFKIPFVKFAWLLGVGGLTKNLADNADTNGYHIWAFKTEVPDESWVAVRKDVVTDGWDPQDDGVEFDNLHLGHVLVSPYSTQIAVEAEVTDPDNETLVMDDCDIQISRYRFDSVNPSN